MAITFARGEDPLRADKLNAAFGERVARAGDTMAGMLTLAHDPVNPLDAATKRYVDAQGPVSGPGPGGLTQNVVSVLDYGAMGDGVTDDTDAIQSVLDTFADKATVLIPNTGNTYMCHGLYMPSDTDLLLFGTLKSVPNSTAHLINLVLGRGRVTIRGYGILDANKAEQSQLISCINGSSDFVKISDIYIQNSNVWNVNITVSNHVRLNNVSMVGGTAANEFAAGCNDCWITGCYINGVAEDEGFCFYGNVTNSGAIGNIVTGAGADGINILCDGPQPLPCTNITIADNICYNNKGSGIQINRGVGGTNIHQNIIITGNRVYSNNVWDSATGAEIHIDFAANVVVTGNLVTGDDTHVSAHGIMVGGSTLNTTITGNSVISIGGAARPGFGIYLASPNIVSATGNMFHDYRSTSYMTGIGGAAGIKNAFTGNVFGTVAGKFGFTGTQPDTIVSGPTDDFWSLTARGISYNGGQIIAFDWSGTGVTTKVNGSLQGTLVTGPYMTTRPNAVNDAAAATAGVAVGEAYRNGSAVMVRMS